MGTVFNRGTKDAPNWYVGYREDGRWVYKPSRQPTKALAKRWVAEIESRIARGQVGIEDDDEAPAFKVTFDSFLEGLTNRNAADDRSRGRRHLLPHFQRRKLADIDLGAVMEWIDEQRAAGELGEASIRHNMNLLSRFFSWAIARGKASINPVRLIPMGSRPTQSVKSDTPWLDDDAIVRKLINDLEEPIAAITQHLLGDCASGPRARVLNRDAGEFGETCELGPWLGGVDTNLREESHRTEPSQGRFRHCQEAPHRVANHVNGDERGEIENTIAVPSDGKGNNSREFYEAARDVRDRVEARLVDAAIV